MVRNLLDGVLRASYMSSEPLYRDKTWLEHKYKVEGLNQREIAEECNSSQSAISEWLNRHGIPTGTGSGYSKDGPWRDEEELLNQLGEFGTAAKVAENMGVSKSTISRWLDRHGIDFDGRKTKIPKFTTRKEHDYAYEGWSVYVDGSSTFVRHHRLLATLLVNDLEELKGKHVHHINEIPWDNRIENFELVTMAEHSRVHEMWKESPQSNPKLRS